MPNNTNYSLRSKAVNGRRVFWLTGTVRGDALVPELKAAGFWFHGDRSGCRRSGACAACAAGAEWVWFTLDERIARSVEWAADAETAAILGSKTSSLQASRATDAEVEIPAPAGLSYLPYQKAGIRFASERTHSLIGDEMGLGKTIQALGLINLLGLATALIVCPASLKINWQREAAKWLVRSRKIQVVAAGDAIDPAAEIVIVNYELVRRPEVKQALMARSWNLLVLDEAHRVKNQKAQQTAAVLGAFDRRGNQTEKGLFDAAERVVALTGTPIPNRPVEIWSLASRLAPTSFNNFFRFAQQFCAAYQDRFGWHFDGASNMAELQVRLRQTCLVRRTKAEVLTSLPAKRRQTIALAANGAAALLKRERELAGSVKTFTEAFESLRGGAADDFAELSAIRHKLAVSKVAKVVEHCTDLLEGGVQKLVVFAHHHEVVAGIVEGLREFGVTCLTGQTPADQKQAAVDSFQTDPTCRVFVGSIQAAGVGLTLTASDTCVFAELDWVPGNVQQAEDRLHRIGQRGSVMVQFLVYDDSLESRLAHTIASKEDVLEAVLDARHEAEAELVAELTAPARIIAAPAPRTATPVPTRNPIVAELVASVAGEEVPF